MNFKKLVLPFTAPRNDTERWLIQTLNELNLSLDAILNRGIILTDNVDLVEVSFTSNAVANTEDGISHTLGKVPAGYIVISLDKAAVIYKGASAWTKTTIYLKSNVASTAVKILVF